MIIQHEVTLYIFESMVLEGDGLHCTSEFAVVKQF